VVFYIQSMMIYLLLCAPQVISFVEIIDGRRTLYGYRQQTLYSLALLMLTRRPTPFHLNTDESLFEGKKQFFFHVKLLNALNLCGINIIKVNTATCYIEC
jgi:hypothetical protein